MATNRRGASRRPAPWLKTPAAQRSAAPPAPRQRAAWDGSTTTQPAACSPRSPAGPRARQQGTSPASAARRASCRDGRRCQERSRPRDTPCWVPGSTSTTGPGVWAALPTRRRGDFLAELACKIVMLSRFVALSVSLIQRVSLLQTTPAGPAVVDPRDAAIPEYRRGIRAFWLL